MFIRLIQLEIKQFFRNPQLGANIALKILGFFGMFSIAFFYALAGVILYFYAKKQMHLDPLLLLCKYFVYYWIIDLVVRYFIQQMPTQNIKPLLTLNIKKRKLVEYTIFKTFLNFFNWGNLLFLLPFAGLLIVDGGYSVLGVIAFTIGMLFLFYFNNFLNILLNGKDVVFYCTAVVFALFGYLEYSGHLHLSEISEKVFYSLYSTPITFLIPVVLSLVIAYFAYKMIYTNFYLDRGLELQKAVGKTENIEFLNRYGVLGTFLNNDIRLLKRSKAAKSALVASVLFLFYGLLVFSPTYNSDFMRLFTGIFVTGGFMLMFGQRVPAWDSSYYPLMMTQQVPYKEYLKAKWALMVLGIAVSIIFASFYILISWEMYWTIVAAGLYNLGMNSYLTLLAGAYNKKGIDLNSNAKSFGGGGNNFNLKVLLIMIPQLLLPMAVFAAVKYFFGITAAVASLGLLGLIGFLLRNTIFNWIVKVYKNEKYSAISSFKNIS